mgnify:CR=1 FL=1
MIEVIVTIVHNFRRSSYFAFIFLEGKSQSDNLLYREYIADAKT